MSGSSLKLYLNTKLLFLIPGKIVNTLEILVMTMILPGNNCEEPVSHSRKDLVYKLNRIFHCGLPDFHNEQASLTFPLAPISNVTSDIGHAHMLPGNTLPVLSFLPVLERFIPKSYVLRLKDKADAAQQHPAQLLEDEPKASAIWEV